MTKVILEEFSVSLVEFEGDCIEYAVSNNEDGSKDITIHIPAAGNV